MSWFRSASLLEDEARGDALAAAARRVVRRPKLKSMLRFKMGEDRVIVAAGLWECALT